MASTSTLTPTPISTLTPTSTLTSTPEWAHQASITPHPLFAHLPHITHATLETEARALVLDFAATFQAALAAHPDPDGWTRLVRILGILWRGKYLLDPATRANLYRMAHHMVFAMPLPIASKLAFLTEMTDIIRKKKHVQGLEIDWKPFEILLRDTYFTKIRRKTSYSEYGFASNLIRHAQDARKYFSEKAIQEILEFYDPLVCPHDQSLYYAQSCILTFLPTHHQKIVDYLPKAIQSWRTLDYYEEWDYIHIAFLSRLAKDQVGNVDWTPYLDFIFTKTLAITGVRVKADRTDGQSVSYFPRNCKVFVSNKKSSLVRRVAILIVYSINKSKETFAYLRNFMTSTETFFHPSNTGTWTDKLGDFITSLAEVFCMRYMKPIKHGNQPTEYDLTLQDCKEFTEILLPVAMSALYSKKGTMVSYASNALRYLASVQPDITIPKIIEQASGALQTLTEIHQTNSIISALGDVCRTLVNPHIYKDGIQYLLSLLQLTLPGIDPNDPDKTTATMKFYSVILALVPLQQASVEEVPPAKVKEMVAFIQKCTPTKQVVDPLSEEGQIIDSYARECADFFMDFSLQYLDRIMTVFSLRDSPSKKKNQNDELYESFYQENVSMLFYQMSPQIHAACLRKIVDYVRSNVNSNCKKQIGYLCSAAVATYPVESLRAFLPLFLDTLLTKEGELKSLSESEMIWNMSLLKDCVRNGNSALLPYKSRLVVLLKKTLHYTKSQLVCKEAGKILRKILKTVSRCYVEDFRSLSDGIRQSAEFKRYPWMYWGAFFQYENADIPWHIPTKGELDFVAEIYHELVDPALMALEEYTGIKSKTEAIDYSRDHVTKSLAILRNFLRGALDVLPEYKLQADQSESRRRSQLTHSIQQISSGSKVGLFEEQGEAMVSRISGLLHGLFEYTQSNTPDDVRTLSTLLKVINIMILRTNTKQLNEIPSKKAQGTMLRLIHDRVHSQKTNARWAIAHRLDSVHSVRIFIQSNRLYYHSDIATLFGDVIKACTNLYAKPRNHACNTASTVLRIYNWAVEQHYPELLTVLSSHDVREETAEGAIQFLKTKNMEKQIFKSWSTIHLFASAVLQSQKIQKSTIQKSLESFYSGVTSAFFVPFMHPSQKNPLPTHMIDALGLQSSSMETPTHILDRNDKELKYFDTFVTYIIDMIHSNTLTWKYLIVAYSFLILVCRSVKNAPMSILRVFLEGFSADMPLIRSLCYRGASTYLEHQKDTTFKSLSPREEISGHIQYDISHELTKEEWYQTRFYDKNYFGWNGLQPIVSFYKYDPAANDTARPSDIALDLLNSDAFFKAIVSKHEAENRQPNQAGFSDDNAQLFKGLFGRYQDAFLETLKPHLVHLAHLKDERACQAIAAEIIAGMVRGSKHWPYEKIQSMVSFVRDILKDAIASATVDNSGIWVSAIQFMVYDRDIRRLIWLRDLLMDFSLEVGNSFSQGKQLSMLSRMVGEFSWRGIQMTDQILDKIIGQTTDMPKNVRDKMSRIVSSVIRNQYHIYISPTPNLRQVSPRLDQYLTEGLKVCRDTVSLPKDHPEYSIHLNRRETFVSIIRELISVNVSKVVRPYLPEIFKTVLFLFDDENQELKLSNRALGNICGKVLLQSDEEISAIISVFEEVSRHQSWHVRLALHNIAQNFIFRHIFTFNPQHNQRIYKLLSEQLLDTQVEVREMSAVTLSGLLKTSKEDIFPELQKTFSRLALTRLQKLRPQEDGQDSSNTVRYGGLVERHAGVLGLVAILRAFPYRVPSWLPDILVEIATHATDPPPIGSSVKKAFGEFWKTHQDMWHIHKELFSEDQLGTLTQMLVAPSYYS